MKLSRLKNIKIFLMDVDGVLTDGKMFYFTDANGIDHEFKAFNSQDGIGLIVLNKFGIITGIVTGRESESVFQRASLLKMRFVYQGFLTKKWACDEILKKTNLTYENLCYMGDDIPDIPVLKRAGFAVCPSNAVDEVKRVCHYIATKKGGDGAVREVCDMIIKAKGFVDDVKRGFEEGIWPKNTCNYKIENVLYSVWRKNRK
jgi:3-deoxy-D-manno-octulosonate 8-phosphate phosphatase (KDO 8-P phosphatase)